MASHGADQGLTVEEAKGRPMPTTATVHSRLMAAKARVAQAIINVAEHEGRDYREVEDRALEATDAAIIAGDAMATTMTAHTVEEMLHMALINAERALDRLNEEVKEWESTVPAGSVIKPPVAVYYGPTKADAVAEEWDRMTKWTGQLAMARTHISKASAMMEVLRVLDTRGHELGDLETSSGHRLSNVAHKAASIGQRLDAHQHSIRETVVSHTTVVDAVSVMPPFPMDTIPQDALVDWAAGGEGLAAAAETELVRRWMEGQGLTEEEARHDVAVRVGRRKETLGRVRTAHQAITGRPS